MVSPVILAYTFVEKYAEENYMAFWELCFW